MSCSRTIAKCAHVSRRNIVFHSVRTKWMVRKVDPDKELDLAFVGCSHSSLERQYELPKQKNWWWVEATSGNDWSKAGNGLWVFKKYWLILSAASCRVRNRQRCGNSRFDWANTLSEVRCRQESEPALYPSSNHNDANTFGTRCWQKSLQMGGYILPFTILSMNLRSLRKKKMLGV